MVQSRRFVPLEPESAAASVGHILADLRAALARGAALPDDDLADLVAESLTLGVDLELAYFLEAAPWIAGRPIVLDAAIEAVIRSMGRRGTAPGAAAKTLADNYPHFARAIQTATLLNEAMTGTTELAARMVPSRTLTLPSSRGPVGADGKPRYELQQLIGVGSQGTVYLAFDRALSEPSHPAWVAVKQLHRPSWSSLDRDRASDEASKARRIQHPNVVRVLDRFVGDDDSEFVVYEYVRGGTLEAWRMNRGAPTSPRDAARLVMELARGVQAAHSVSLVHRDIKPSNVLMTEGEVPKVTDFGAAASLANTGVGPRVGSLGFVAPEQYRQEPGPTTAAADVYGLGGVLYWLLTGKCPNGATPLEAAEGLTNGRVAPDFPPGIDDDLIAICARALDRKPAARYQSADSLANDLKAWLGHEVISWNSPSAIRRLVLSAKRGPKAAAFLSGLVVLLAAMTVLAGLAWGNARAERAKREVADERRALDAERSNTVNQVGEAYFVFLKNAPHSLNTNWVGTLTFIESTLGPVYCASSEDGKLLWPRRVEVARSLVDAAHAKGEPVGLEVTLHECALGLWLINSGNYVEAETRLATSLEWFASHLSPADPILREVRVLHLCAQGFALGTENHAIRAAFLHKAQLLTQGAESLSPPIKGVLARFEIICKAPAPDQQAQ